MCSLTERVALLENMLKERGAEPPPANHPPKTRHAIPRDKDSSPQREAGKPPNNVQEHSSPGSQQDDFIDIDHIGQDNGSNRDDEGDAPSPPVLSHPKKDGMI
ncbi:hypothetical protein AOQ84DRAFT_363673 [Glonium stellatum]|uniref:Uncharacterized protein n=1 Tax=Glonium stellatum TaxID=574774 RepID=A0A8E2JTJ4_9PEZI|nr:hypothetical protein AOQ84DRAFT_363673 [Glonium stellatum]